MSVPKMWARHHLEGTAPNLLKFIFDIKACSKLGEHFVQYGIIVGKYLLSGLVEGAETSQQAVQTTYWRNSVNGCFVSQPDD